MTYSVPGGWVETYTQDLGFRKKIVFHEKRDCHKVHHSQLRPVTRPGSAARCQVCSPAR